MSLTFELVRSIVDKISGIHNTKLQIMLLTQNVSTVHVISESDIGEIPDKYHYVRFFEGKVVWEQQRTFPLPSSYTDDVEEYFRRIILKSLNMQIFTTHALVIYASNHFSLSPELNTIYIQDHHTLEQIIKNESGSNVFVASIIEGELAKFGYHIDYEGTIEMVPSAEFPEWLKIIKTEYDMIQNPMNEKYWNEVSYYTNPPELKYYWGEHLFISPGINRCMIKINDVLWLDVDLDILITTSHYYPKEIQQELAVWQSIY